MGITQNEKNLTILIKGINEWIDSVEDDIAMVTRFLKRSVEHNDDKFVKKYEKMIEEKFEERDELYDWLSSTKELLKKIKKGETK